MQTSKFAKNKSCSISTKVGNIKVGVFVVLGQCFMKIWAKNPFESADVVSKLCWYEVYIESIWEKVGFRVELRWYSLMCRWSTYTCTNCWWKILPNGTAYITDLGMYGSYEFVLGRELQEIQVYSMRSGMTRKLEVENKNIMLNQIILHDLII